MVTKLSKLVLKGEFVEALKVVALQRLYIYRHSLMHNIKLVIRSL